MTDTRDSFVNVKPVIVADTPDAHQVWLDIGVQHFTVGEYCETKEDAEWHAAQLRIALTALQSGAGGAQDAARYKFAFEHCYGLLDDIDTAGDVAKYDDKLYRQIVENTHIKRLKFSGSDGYAITIKAQAIDNAQATEGK